MFYAFYERNFRKERAFRCRSNHSTAKQSTQPKKPTDQWSMGAADFRAQLVSRGMLGGMVPAPGGLWVM